MRIHQIYPHLIIPDLWFKKHKARIVKAIARIVPALMMAGLPCLSLLSAETSKLLRPCYSMVQRLIAKSLKADGNWFALGGSENKCWNTPAVVRGSSAMVSYGFHFSSFKNWVIWGHPWCLRHLWEIANLWSFCWSTMPPWTPLHAHMTGTLCVQRYRLITRILFEFCWTLLARKTQEDFKFHWLRHCAWLLSHHQPFP